MVQYLVEWFLLKAAVLCILLLVDLTFLSTLEYENVTILMDAVDERPDIVALISFV